MGGDTGVEALRFCVAVLRERARAAGRDAWLWRIRARVAEQYLALRAGDEPAAGAAGLTEAERSAILHSHPLLQDTRTDSGSRDYEGAPWREALRRRVRRYVAGRHLKPPPP
jgi:hypothetical protein